jgi:hypothetical protein
VLLGGLIPPGVCMLRAGLYAGLGSFGMATSICASKGNFEGILESVLLEGISRGPAGLKELGMAEDLDVSGTKSAGEGILKGGPLTADAEELVESARASPVWTLVGMPEPLNLTNRSSNSRLAGLEKIVACS